MPRKHLSVRYADSVQKRRSIETRGREPKLPPANSCQELQITSEQCILTCRGGGDKKMTTAAAMIGLVAAVFRLAVDASGTMKTWWVTLVTLIHNHTK